MQLIAHNGSVQRLDLPQAPPGKTHAPVEMFFLRGLEWGEIASLCFALFVWCKQLLEKPVRRIGRRMNFHEPTPDQKLLSSQGPAVEW